MDANEFDYVILGAGPAGLQLAYYLHKAERNYIVLERGSSPGTFFKTFPRHRRLLSINKMHTGFPSAPVSLRWDWNSLLSDDDSMLFTRFSSRYFPSANDLVSYLETYATHFNLRIKYDVDIARISKDRQFRLQDRH